MTQDRVIIVTGAGTGIGKGIAEKYISNGDRVAIVGRTREALESVAQGLPNVLVVVADVSIVDDCHRIVHDTLHGFNTDHIDILVNNAGVLNKLGLSVESTPVEDWDIVMNTNLRSAFLLSQLVIPHMVNSTKGPNIVNISSLCGTNSFKNMLPYCVSKSGMDQLTKCSALELAKYGIRVNSINPATVETEFHKRGGFKDEEYEQFLKDMVELHPIGTTHGVCQPSQVAELVFFVSSEQASYITGASIPIDGGRSKLSPAANALTKSH
jgi:NAD(P)-dependent dehydrogenase (short-subunit alcohol dehydrogenase family)